MKWRCRLGMMDFWVHLILVFGLISGALAGVCNKMEACNNDFKDGLDTAGISDPEPSAAYCAELRSYSQCIKKSIRTCRGDLNFHSATTLIETLMKRYNCTHNTNLSVSNRRPTPSSRHNSRPFCSFSSSTEHQHCGLFGDPHLKTFSKKYQTCHTEGAWPLINNKFLAVQVTNRPITNTYATVITKITVIIKETACSSSKTYEATSDLQLQPHFTDGSYKTGPDGSVTISSPPNNEKNEKVEIYIRYIDTTLIIRRVGEFLGFSCKMPEEIVNSGDQDVIELCRTGCPSTELTDTTGYRGHKLNGNVAFAECKNIAYLDGERKFRLTDHYLDWCVYDVMVTGSHQFVLAAYAAQADALQLDPTSLNNRTYLLKFNWTNDNSGVKEQFSFALLLLPLLSFVL